MEKLFKKHFWVVKLLGLAGATGLAASAITTQIGSSMLFEAGDEVEEAKDGEEDEDEEDAKKDAPPRSRSGGSKSRQGLAKNIVERNIFCPTCTPATDEPPAQLYDADGRPIGPVIRPGEVKTSLPLKLMATMESSDPKYSFATIYDDDSGGAGLYSIDDVVRPGVLVTGIDRGLVHIRNGAALEYIEISAELEKKKEKSSKGKKGSKKKKPKKSDRAIPGASDAINCPSDALCLVEREFVEKLMANPALLAKQARVVPSVKDGETVGFKFYGIRRDSLPKLLGLKNGDLLTHVNGEELTSMDKAMGLYTKLRRASNLSVTLERKGKTMNKEIQIK